MELPIKAFRVVQRLTLGQQRYAFFNSDQIYNSFFLQGKGLSFFLEGFFPSYELKEHSHR